jgi:hypothetical protein
VSFLRGLARKNQYNAVFKEYELPQRGIMLIEKTKQTFLVLQRSTIKMNSTISLLWSENSILY